jgi:hypothetical protein
MRGVVDQLELLDRLLHLVVSLLDVKVARKLRKRVLLAFHWRLKLSEQVIDLFILLLLLVPDPGRHLSVGIELVNCGVVFLVVDYSFL